MACVVFRGGVYVPTVRALEYFSFGTFSGISVNGWPTFPDVSNLGSKDIDPWDLCIDPPTGSAGPFQSLSLLHAAAGPGETNMPAAIRDWLANSAWRNLLLLS